MDLEVWLSGENLPLSRAEAAAVAELLGGSILADGSRGRVRVRLPARGASAVFSRRLALAHRTAEVHPPSTWTELESLVVRAGATRRSAAFQWVPGGAAHGPASVIPELGRAYLSGGGRISLGRPERRFWVEAADSGRITLFETLDPTGRAEVRSRATPKLAFQRPVTLAPRLARTVVNLARIRAGDRVVDPFLGTGSLLLEAALLGAETTGVDMDAAMVRGALRNFAQFGQSPAGLRQADAEAAAAEFPESTFDALVTDPPYGRASGTRGEPAGDLWHRAITAWSSRVRPGGRLAVVVPQGTEEPIAGTRLEASIPQRVHRSLTREFRVYLRV